MVDKMKVYDVRFKTKSTITISGPSQSGKSTLVEKIVKSKDFIFTEPIKTVQWFCAFIPKERIPNVEYSISIPTSHDIKSNSLVIIDDYMSEVANSSEFTNLLTKGVHHLPFTLIYITQNIFQKGSDSKTRRLNTNYLILFKNPHDKLQIDYLGRQMFPRDKDFLASVFDHVTVTEPYSYILIDCHQSTPDEIRVRSNIIDDIKMMRAYTPLSIRI